MVNELAPIGFGDRLSEVLAQRGQVCVGIDPHPGLLEQWGLPNSAAGAQEFGHRIVAAIGESAGVVKPQAALFEQFGSQGVSALASVVARAREAGLMCIMDAKRGDIGSTMAAYGRAAFAGIQSDLAVDALTVSPYLGWGSLDPAISLALEAGGGIFVLALTSNPEGEALQLAQITTEGGTSSVAASIVSQAAAANARENFTQMGSVGLVVGATVAERVRKAKVDLAAFNGPFLVPGVGAQGGQVRDLRVMFGQALGNVVVNVSRGAAGLGPDPAPIAQYLERLRDEIAAV